MKWKAIVQEVVRIMRIHIIGGCGSGKTYIAKRLSKELGIEHYQTDNLVWDRSDPNNHIKYPKSIRDELLQNIILQDSWIVEGVHQEWVHSSFAEADYIFIIKPSLFIRNRRTLTRFIKTRLGMEERNYTQDIKNLLVMFRWNRDFERKKIYDILEATSRFAEKRHIVKSNMDILKLLNI